MLFTGHTQSIRNQKPFYEASIGSEKLTGILKKKGWSIDSITAEVDAIIAKAELNERVVRD